MKIGLLGFGTVGSGVEKIAAGTAKLEIVKILDRDPAKMADGRVTQRFEDIVEDKDIDCVVEAMGGIHPAREYILASLQAGKHVVTANKAVVAAHMEEFVKAATASNVKFMVEATSGGGIPWIKNLQRAARIDEITRIHGIMNGTSNFILYNMFESGADFDAVLAEAQQLGYAEADPSADIDGDDVRNKCAISATVAFKGLVPVALIPKVGIRLITKADVDWCKKQGLVCKLFATALREGDAWCATVEPVLLRAGELEAAVPKNYNITCLSGATIGDLKFYGQGAGSLPTGNAIVQDLLDIAAGEAWPLAFDRELKHEPNLLQGKYLVRVSSPTAVAKAAFEPISERWEDDGPGRTLIYTKQVGAGDLHRAVTTCRQYDSGMWIARFA
ncbi:MAG TPA: homoserine dehydrogenase [Candidatus Acidoferrum sp.]|nr:homoserine dehydrogenase [Candidatus Acidoferrum sp.]